MSRLYLNIAPILFCFTVSLLSACASSDPVHPDTSDTIESADTTPAEDTAVPTDNMVSNDTLEPQDTSPSEDVLPDVPESEDPCEVGYPPSLQLGQINQEEMVFEVLKNGDPLLFEFGPQGSDMVVLDLLHKGTAGLDFLLDVEIRDTNSGELLIAYSSQYPGAISAEFPDSEGNYPDDPRWSCVPEMGNVLNYLWLEDTGAGLVQGTSVALQATATYDRGTNEEALVLSFEVEGVLTYNL